MKAGFHKREDCKTINMCSLQHMTILINGILTKIFKEQTKNTIFCAYGSTYFKFCQSFSD